MIPACKKLKPNSGDSQEKKVIFAGWLQYTFENTTLQK